MNYKIIILFCLFIFGIFYSAPSLTNSETGKKINLGLDLQGGMYLLLEVHKEEAVKSNFKSITMNLSRFFQKNDILIDESILKAENNEINFSLLDEDDIITVVNKLKNMEGVSFKNVETLFAISFSDLYIKELEDLAVTQAIQTIRNRLDQYGLSEPTVARKGKDNILVELPGIKTQEEEQRARELISKTAKLEILAVDEDRNSRVLSMTSNEAAQYGDIIIDSIDNGNLKLLVKELPVLTGNMLIDAQVGFDENNRPVINFSLNSEGASIFGDFTEKNIGKRTAIVLDGINYSAPVVRSRIGGGHVQVSGDYTIQEANDLAIALRSGSLLAPISVLEKRSIGPSLGADSIKASLIALLSGFLLVFFFMIIYYRKSGFIANIALLTNLFLIIGIMALFGATLTLPGMAGIVLTVGMAVDANVIILERIRELIKNGTDVKDAIEAGYEKASTAIIDANITTLIAAVLLYGYGTGPVKGFALTISIGILASMITSIIGTKGIFDFIIKNEKMNEQQKMNLIGIKGN